VHTPPPPNENQKEQLTCAEKRENTVDCEEKESLTCVEALDLTLLQSMTRKPVYAIGHILMWPPSSLLQ